MNFSNNVNTVDFIVTVPNEVSVSINDNFGEISVADTKGNVDIKNSFGNITIENVEGAVMAKTNSGEVTATSIQSGRGCDLALVNISTISPFCSSVDKCDNLPLIFAP